MKSDPRIIGIDCRDNDFRSSSISSSGWRFARSSEIRQYIESKLVVPFAGYFLLSVGKDAREGEQMESILPIHGISLGIPKANLSPFLGKAVMEIDSYAENNALTYSSCGQRSVPGGGTRIAIRVKCPGVLSPCSVSEKYTG